MAEQWAEGHAYVLVGVEEGHLHGTAEVDVVRLHPKLTQFTGEGPRFQYTYVPCDAGHGVRQVLFVDVAPPRWGDPIHPLRKEYDRNPNGRVFMRYMGETKPAKATDVDLLCERVRRREQRMNITVQRTEGAIASLSITQADEEALWEQWRDGMLASLPQVQPQRKPARGGAGFPVLDDSDSAGPSAREVIALRTRVRQGQQLTDEERKILERAQAGTRPLAELMASLSQYGALAGRDARSVAGYREEIEEYMTRCREVLPDAIRNAVAAHATPVRLELVNRSGNHLTQVQIIVTIDRAFAAVLPRDADSRGPYLRWPKAPVPYGQSHNVGLPAVVQNSAAAGNYASLAELYAPSEPDIEASAEALTIRFPPEDLRSHATLRLEPLVVYGIGTETDSVSIRWSATCTNLDGRVSDELPLPVQPLGVDLPALLNPPPHWLSRRRTDR
ncbi:hypothetical protein F3K20_23630 [Streptomyces scabiei]|uniref:hypothetical protein n=1 Tax=Streptomyces scabiei TaxID=1930 RepID=UPI001B307F10|nr:MULTISPECIES: hypothetical protein [unclassified Streptomyces]QTU47411.1 hypothetical protein F3K20_23630 [Streptomyces sp. LBUM 1482]QTU63458.1 hypothetical protein F3K22_22795 [Streptomyces sp. LBUM 1475]